MFEPFFYKYRPQFCLNGGDQCRWPRSDHPDDSLQLDGNSTVWSRIHKCGLMYQAICHKIPFCSISKGNKSILLISNNSEMGSGHCEPAPLGLISGFPSHHNDACWIPLRSSRCKHNWFLMDYSSALMPAADLKEWFSIGVLSSECQRTASHPDQIWQEARGRLAGRGGKRSHNSGA